MCSFIRRFLIYTNFKKYKSSRRVKTFFKKENEQGGQVHSVGYQDSLQSWRSLRQRAISPRIERKKPMRQNGDHRHTSNMYEHLI